MDLIHETKVLPSEIDSLGHMNVRYYMARMERANRTLLSGLGIEAADDAMLWRSDTYTRFRQEQFEGADLETHGGVLGLGEAGMQSYVEIRNAQSQDVAATFIVTTSLINTQTRSPLPLPLDSGACNARRIEVPDYAQPRSLAIGPVNTEISLADLDACIPEVEGGGMMSGKRSALVEDEDVDADGWLAPDRELMFLPFTKAMAQSNTTHGPPVFTTPDGRRVGWAVMETRTMYFGQARLGDDLAYFSADLAIEAKSRLSRRWAYNRHTGALLGMSDTVGLCIDLDARRAVEWPAELRREIEHHLQPQLA